MFDVQECMNWDAVNFDWNHIKAFLATAEEGSFSAAARALKTTQPTINRQISGLEDALGVTLFERGRRGLILTAAGQELIDHVRSMGTSASRISMVATGQSEAIEGEVSITAVDIMGLEYVIPALVRLHEEHPRLKIRILASNEVQDLGRREADIAVRHIRPEQPDLYAKLVATMTASFYASPDYLKEKGHAHSLEDLQSYPVIGVTDAERFLEVARERGLVLNKEQFTHASNSGILDLELVRRGLGIALLADQIGEGDPMLEKVYDDFPPFEFPVWLTTHRELHTSKKIRVVFNALRDVWGG